MLTRLFWSFVPHQTLLGIILNFSALLIVAQIDDACTPFVMNAVGLSYDRTDLEYEVEVFLENYDFSEAEVKTFQETKQLRRSIIFGGIAIAGAASLQ